MKLGITELLLLLCIASVLIGPTVLSWVLRWTQRAQKTAAVQARRRMAYEAQRRAERDALLRRFQIGGAVFLLAAAGLLAGYLFFRPIEVTPRAYSAPAAAEEDAGSRAALETLALDGYRNPVCVRWHEGWLYAAADGGGAGALVRVREDGTGLQEVVNAGAGHEITSFVFDDDGSVLFTDAGYPGGGALCRASFDAWGVTIEPLVTQMRGTPLGAVSAVALAPDGKIYFAEAAGLSAAGGGDAGGADTGMAKALRTELLAHTATGCVYVYDPAAKTVETVVSGLSWAGGLAFSPDGATLYVSELTMRRIWAVPAAARGLTAGGRGCEAFAQELWGYPAGLSVDEDGLLWAAYYLPRIDWLERHSEGTFLRGAALRLPAATRLRLFDTETAGSFEAFDASGTSARRITLDTDGVGGLTGVYPMANRLYITHAGGQSVLGFVYY